MTMSIELIVTFVGVSIALVGLLLFAYKKIPKRMRKHKNIEKWRSIQQLLADQRSWPSAVVMADDLLDKMMKHRRHEGKTTGERLVSCQNKFTDNDSLWRAHKLANKLRDNTQAQSVKISEKDMKATMMAFGQAMKDLGAL